MVKHSLFRRVTLFLIDLVRVSFSSLTTSSLAAVAMTAIITTLFLAPALAATEESQIEKDLQLEELNIGADSAADMSIPTSSAPVASPNQALEEPLPPKSEPSFTNEDLRANANGYVIDERDYTPDNTVTVEKTEDPNLPYKQRRGKHGVLFSIGMETIEPTEYYSLIETTDVGIKDLLGGSSMSMLNVELGYKYNFSLGSAYVIGAYATGSNSNTADAIERKLEVSRMNLSLGYQADMLFDEPWVVPYAQVGVHQFNVSEKRTTATTSDSNSASTEPSLNYRAGLLFQLNWIEKSIDPMTHSDGIRSSGLENTFLDVYATWYEPSESSSGYDPNDATTHNVDPDMRSEATIGVALKMEF